MEDNSFKFYKKFYEENRIVLLQYDSLRKHFKIMIEKILGKNYYNMEMDVYSSDQTCCEDITKKLKSGIIERILTRF